MATYGGGTVFSSIHSFVNITPNSTVAVIGDPGANAYTEFQPLSATVITAVGNPVTIQLIIQSDNGLGGWTNTTTITTSAMTTDAPVNSTFAFPGQQVWKIFPGQRVIAVDTGFPGHVIRISFSALTYTPST